MCIRDSGYPMISILQEPEHRIHKNNIPDLSHVAVPLWKAQKMYAVGYRFVGRHSAIKICEWTRESIRGKNVCYKCKFYGIHSNQCIQMSPAVQFCDFNCKHCWRSLSYTLPPEQFEWDGPKFILDGCIEAQRQILQGFKGSESADQQKVIEAMMPQHVAISLSGEPTLYPRLPEFVDEIMSRDMTAYLVTNGTHPEMIQRLVDHQPTNLYMTLPAPDKEHYVKECAPMISNGWEKIMQTMSLFRQFTCRTLVRLTLNRKHNLFAPEKYAEMLEAAQPSVIECKSYMAVGGARKKLGPEFMVTHEDIRSFAQVIENNAPSYKIMNEKADSRVVMLQRKDLNLRAEEVMSDDAFKMDVS